MAKRDSRIILAVTPGDPDGIGPEILWKTIRGNAFDSKRCALLCVGAREPFERLGAKIIEADPSEPLIPPPLQSSGRNPFIWLLPAPTQSKKFLPGFQSGWSIETATRLALDKRVGALVTGPISKERLQRGGYPYPGHTEFLASLCGVKHVTMMLANDQLRVALVTTHVAIQDVSNALTRERLRRTIAQTLEHLRKWWGIRQPLVAVTGLNPHAGESGIFGREEIEVISPVISSMQRSSQKSPKLGRFTLAGPLSADTLFATHILSGGTYDAVVCMYHDQALIPVKLLDFHKTVNVTLGLPIIRTSVDHGTGFDIVGKGIANPSSLQSAIRLALEIALTHRREYLA